MQSLLQNGDKIVKEQIYEQRTAKKDKEPTDSRHPQASRRAYEEKTRPGVLLSYDWNFTDIVHAPSPINLLSLSNNPIIIL